MKLKRLLAKTGKKSNFAAYSPLRYLRHIHAKKISYKFAYPPGSESDCEASLDSGDRQNCAEYDRAFRIWVLFCNAQFLISV